MYSQPNHKSIILPLTPGIRWRSPCLRADVHCAITIGVEQVIAEDYNQGYGDETFKLFGNSTSIALRLEFDLP